MSNSFYTKTNDETLVINRDEENKDVDNFQKNGDIRLFEKVYKQRIPSLKNWAMKHYFPGLAPSIEDFLAELRIVFVKAVQKYDVNKGSFNTCLYTFLLNRVKNIKSSKYAKKRKPDTYDGPLSGILLSLDYNYSDGSGDGHDRSLADILESEDSNDYKKTVNEINFQDTLDILAGKNNTLRDVFIKLGRGSTLTSVIKECKIKKGIIQTSKSNIVKLNKRRNKRFVKQLISELEGIKDFSLLEYDINNDTHISYSVELKRTSESDMILKTIRQMRRNKSQLIHSLHLN